MNTKIFIEVTQDLTKVHKDLKPGVKVKAYLLGSTINVVPQPNQLAGRVDLVNYPSVLVAIDSDKQIICLPLQPMIKLTYTETFLDKA